MSHGLSRTEMIERTIKKLVKTIQKETGLEVSKVSIIAGNSLEDHHIEVSINNESNGREPHKTVKGEGKAGARSRARGQI